MTSSRSCHYHYHSYYYHYEWEARDCHYQTSLSFYDHYRFVVIVFGSVSDEIEIVSSGEVVDGSSFASATSDNDNDSDSDSEIVIMIVR